MTATHLLKLQIHFLDRFYQIYILAFIYLHKKCFYCKFKHFKNTEALYMRYHCKFYFISKDELKVKKKYKFLSLQSRSQIKSQIPCEQMGA